MYNFLKVGLAVPQVSLANPTKNAEEIIQLVEQAEKEHIDLLVFPELAVTGATCGDLFNSKHLLQESNIAISKIAQSTTDKNIFVLVGTPLSYMGQVYNTMACIQKGVVKDFLIKKVDHSQSRFFKNPKNDSATLFFTKEGVTAQLFYPNDSFDADILIDPWAVSSNATKENKKYLKEISQKNKAVISVKPGSHESTTDLVFTGEMLVAEHGNILLDERAIFSSKLAITYIDPDHLVASQKASHDENFVNSDFYISKEEEKHFFENFAKHRPINPMPFIPQDPKVFDEIIEMQGIAIARRMKAAGSKKAVIGLSGGVDSTIALFGILKALEFLGKDKTDVIAVTMPGLGTSSGTNNNAKALAKAIGIDLKEISIVDAIQSHFTDIGHNGKPDSAYENAQARERTQILMDLANMHHGIHIGTGDLSESMLGWATYNGDHASMYNPNGSLTKTLIQHTLIHLANNNPSLKDVLTSIVDTPISPELLPPQNDSIAQKTEDLVGKYIINDFFTYYTLLGTAPKKLLFLACQAFSYDVATKDQLKDQLLNFYKRFFASQFKRSFGSDGPMIMGFSLSPRGGLIMPSDAVVESWINELKEY